ncbi:dihydropteroate synthase [Pseudenhygromyxa sp. WMMC2535]|nr:dihydropteroate synthase [Pseudenhygromyxa sp. WMMC2535]
MAIVNLTPDSFSDGGRWLEQGNERPALAAVVEQCRRWVEAGVDVLDVGGESTRPGSAPVEVGVEIERVVPVIAALRAQPDLAEVAISVDTRHAAVARAALEAGAAIVNDVSTLADPEMAGVVAEAGAGLVISHLRGGDPATMQHAIRFEALVSEVAEELAEAVAAAEAAGVERGQIVVDPGLGFGKLAEHSAALLVSSAELAARTGCPVLIGASRKSFLGRLCPGASQAPRERGQLSVAAALLAAERGAGLVRVHDVEATIEALRLREAVAACWAEHGQGRAR